MIKSAERTPAARHDRDEHDESIHAQPDQPLADQRRVPVAGAAFPIQTKLLVGSAADSSEIEAERVAVSVVEALRRHTDSDDPISGSSATLTVLHRHADHGGGGAGVIGADGGEVGHEMEATLHASAGTGSSLAPPLRARLETVLGADLSGIRLHADAEAGRLNRAMSASAFTHGRDIYFRDGLPDAGTESGLRLLAHELTHTVQQGSAPLRRSALTSADHDAGEWTLAEPIHVETEDDGVHRHSAFEHYLLGQLQPKELAAIPAVRDVQKKKSQKKNVAKGHGGGLADQDTSRDTRREVRHLIAQEMARLIEYRDDPEALADRFGEMGSVAQNADGTWQVPIVVLTCRDGEKVVVTYSEMNTLPDLFGNPEAISQTPKAKVLSLLQGVRQQLYIELSELNKEIFGGSGGNELHNAVWFDGDFEGARGPRAQAVVAPAYEIRTEKQVNSATTRPGEEREQYFAALERNACHFAPESWKQWRGYHERALKLADEAAAYRQHAENAPVPMIKESNNKKADELANEALIQNSFGEHYLQDSFAAGHLIDKTKIMQWFTLWVDKNKDGLGWSPSAKAGFAMSMHAAGSNLQSNPQALHDKGVRGELPTAGDAAEEIGMGTQTTPEITMMMRWRALARAKPAKRTLTIAEVSREFVGDRRRAEALLEVLVDKGFVSKDDGTGRVKKALAAVKIGKRNTDPSQFKYTLDKEMVDVLRIGAKERRGLTGQVGKKTAYAATLGRPTDKTGKISDDEANAAAAEFNLASYNLMLSNAYIGNATKFFHDMFCKQGLQVKSKTGADLGRIYGDQNMLNAGGQVGVEYAAETSQWSREAIFNILSGKPEGHTTDQIADRFATQVLVTDPDTGDSSYIDIDKFNDHLRDLGDNRGLFKKASAVKARAGYKFMDGISDKGALDVTKLVSGGHGPF